MVPRFARSVALVTSFNQTYGTLSAVVIFVVAIGLVTTLFLAGISLAHAIQYRDEFRAHDTLLERTEVGGRLYVASRLLLALAGAWENDRATRSPGALVAEVARPEEEITQLLAALRGAGLLIVSVDGDLSLSRAPEKISLYAVSRAIGESAPRAVPAGHDAAARMLHRVFSKANREERAVLQGTSVRDLLPGKREDPYTMGLVPRG